MLAGKEERAGEVLHPSEVKQQFSKFVLKRQNAQRGFVNYPDSSVSHGVDAGDIQLVPYDIESCIMKGAGDALTDSEVCFICCVEPPNGCYMECGHGGVCYSCAKLMATRRPSVCPICRSHISEVLKLCGKVVSVNNHNVTLSHEGCAVTSSRHVSNNVTVDNSEVI
jgi:hypothetical protein